MRFVQGVDDRATGLPPMIGRRLTISEWEQYIATYQFGRVAPDRIVLHHTYIPNESTWRGDVSMRGMQTYYREKGWGSAPHIYTAPDGIWLFTPLDSVGVHAGTGNASYWHGRLSWYSIGVEMVGNFDRKLPAGSVWENTVSVLAALCARMGKEPEAAISFHRDYSRKTCPGSAVTKYWVHQETEKRLAAAPGEMAVVAPPRISAEKFRSILVSGASPAAPFSAELYAVCVREYIDPAVAVAFFQHESGLGSRGICAAYDLKNWGNVRTPEDASLGTLIQTERGPFARYPDWQSGLLDWCRRLKGPKYAGAGLATVERVVWKYAPADDGNSPQAYIEAVRSLVHSWTSSWYVTVTAFPHLRVRQGPGTLYPVAGVLASGARTLVDGTKEEGEGEWLHLASGLGFISAQHTRR